MEYHIFPSSLAASKYAFTQFEKQLKEKKNSVFGLATGSSPKELYQLLRESSLDFSQATSINLDEYYQLSSENPCSYHYFMQEHLFKYKNFKASYIPNGMANNVSEELARYNTILNQHPIDLQLLGIGVNGHIGFNEPGSAITQGTRLVELTPSTIQANQRFFPAEEKPPKQAYSMSIGAIMSAQQIILLAFGEHKAKAIQAVIQGPVQSEAPASILQEHPHATLLLDEAAAQLL